MTIDAPLDARTAAVPPAPVNGLLTVAGSLPTLLKLALPNTIANVRHDAGLPSAETSYNRPARHRAAGRDKHWVSLRHADRR